MTNEKAMRLVPVYSRTEIPHREEARDTMFTRFINHMTERIRVGFRRKYGILLMAAAAFTIYTILLSAGVETRTERRVRQEMAGAAVQAVEQYKAELAYQAQAEHFLSGEASREAAINQAVDAVAQVISKLSTDAQKATEACCMLARVMSTAYPNSFQEVAAQPQQWMFYNGEDNTFSQHDREIAERIVRPYMESGIVPNGLTAEMVYGEWTQHDFVLRDSYKTTSTMHTWRYQG